MLKQINKKVLNSLFYQKISASFIVSFIFFLIAMSLDFYITNVSSNGDWTMEANVIARLWWQIMGPFRFIEIPIYATGVFCIAYIINIKNKFFPLFWLNLLAFNHLFGFITWLPYRKFNFLDVLSLWAIVYPIGLMSALISLPLTLIQIYIMPKNNK